LALGPEARLLAYGGDDGVVQTYDLRQGKPLGQCEIDAAVLSLDLTGKGLLAVGGADRLARVFDIGTGVSLFGCTKSETMPIASVVFYGDDHLFTAGSDNLKAWDLTEGLTLTDNIETSSRGILHMVVGENIQQIAFSSGTLSYHQCLLS
jgi:WD40 repeat protein